ncbi:hypothetical protein [Streptomyces spiramenti]|uniref:Uncharacterized protein n=1 Tax=Streptomyces spiramenti TaxID=2720606 RepID=A0ABX1AK87_9ACTN|nr:hypothetical protein [Streptomyces spiramenti]NJP66086.1 hypothetical protein [Streptomyces spiramenti]
MARTAPAEFEGRWRLVGAADEEPVVTLADTADDVPSGGESQAVVAGVRVPLAELTRRWLAGESFGRRPPPEPVTGLRLEIDETGGFTEFGTAQLPWFSDEGVLEATARPFGGRIAAVPAGIFLLLDKPVAWARGYDESAEVPARLDDGDTVVTDRLCLENGRLLRTVSVVTDGATLSRLRYEYVAAS